MAENKSASFEASLARLTEIVAELERDNVELERAVTLYGEGRDLVARCEGLLKTAEETLRQTAEANGTPPATPQPDDEIPF
ncbi:MAG TPA: exodeoxyribonuclease VII small subunit [Candidatus Elarobacter sp.]